MIAIRVQMMLTTPEAVTQLVRSLGGVAMRVPWNEAALVVDQIDTRALTATDAYMNGWFYIQSLPSMIPALVLDPQQGDTVLDLCAAPGSKTTQLAELMRDKGVIIANDVSRDRLYKLRANVDRMHLTSIQYSMMPGAGIWRKYPDYFDAVLADVPCSMGQEYAPKNLKMLVSRQKKLIRSAYSALKPGHTMVYSTCSPRIEENERVVEYLLKHEPGAELVPVAIHGLPKDWIAENGTVHVYTNEQHEDFFVAQIRKNNPE